MAYLCSWLSFAAEDQPGTHSKHSTGGGWESYCPLWRTRSWSILSQMKILSKMQKQESRFAFQERWYACTPYPMPTYSQDAGTRERLPLRGFGSGWMVRAQLRAKWALYACYATLGGLDAVTTIWAAELHRNCYRTASMNWPFLLIILSHICYSVGRLLGTRYQSSPLLPEVCTLNFPKINIMTFQCVCNGAV